MRRLLASRPHSSVSLVDALVTRLSISPDLRTVAIFAALPGEPDLLPLPGRIPGRRWVFPRVNGASSLGFHLVADPYTELVPGAFGIREPSPGMPEIPVGEIDAFLCPGLAFDPHGGRLGRGRGFYDRILSLARPDALRIGVCHGFQIVPDTFPQAHDMLMHEVISG